MTRPVTFCAALLLLGASQAQAQEAACTYGGDLAEWVGAMVRRSDYVLVGRVSAVLSLAGDSSVQIAVLEVRTPLKGSLHEKRVWSRRSATNFYPMVGEVRVFFVDRHASVVGCSDYPGDQTEQVLREVERALRGSPT